MKTLNKEDLIKISARRVEIPELDGCVYVSVMSVKSRIDFMEMYSANDEQKLPIDKVLALAIVDEKGKPLYSLDEAESLNQMSSVAADRIIAEWMKINGLTAKAEEDAVKNSERRAN